MDEGTWSGKGNGSLPECTGDMAVRMRKGTGHTAELTIPFPEAAILLYSDGNSFAPSAGQK